MLKTDGGKEGSSLCPVGETGMGEGSEKGAGRRLQASVLLLGKGSAAASARKRVVLVSYEGRV